MRHSVEARKPLVSLPLTLCACANLIGGDAPTVDEALDVVWLKRGSRNWPPRSIAQGRSEPGVSKPRRLHMEGVSGRLRGAAAAR